MSDSESTSSIDEELPIPTKLRLLFISDTKVIVAWDIDEGTGIGNRKFNVQTNPSHRGIKISQDRTANQATI